MSAEYRILIIEDEISSREILKNLFELNGFSVLTSETGKYGYELICSCSPDITVMDLGLPDMDGLKLLRKIRMISDIPVLVLSARSEEYDKVTALEMGADDYVTKPFGSLELIARIKNALRHRPLNANNKNNEFFRYENLFIDYKTKHVTIDGNEIHLTANEYNILSLLSKNSGKTLTYENIIRSIWGVNPDGNTGILRVNITNIRKKIERDTSNPEYIITETGIGYRIPKLK